MSAAPTEQRGASIGGPIWLPVPVMALVSELMTQVRAVPAGLCAVIDVGDTAATMIAAGAFR